jgi:hypothetical protein
LPEDVTVEQVATGLGRLLDKPVEVVLPTHGDPPTAQLSNAPSPDPCDDDAGTNMACASRAPECLYKQGPTEHCGDRVPGRALDRAPGRRGGVGELSRSLSHQFCNSCYTKASNVIFRKRRSDGSGPGDGHGSVAVGGGGSR